MSETTQASPSFPPRAICIAGALALATGANSVAQMIAGLLGGIFTLDPGFVGIPIGHGILVGRASSRHWALLFAGAGVLVFAVAIARILLAPFEHEGYSPHPEDIHAIAGWSVAAASCLYVFIVLMRKDHKAWFGIAREESGSARSFSWAVAIVAGTFLVAQHTMEWRMKKTYSLLYDFRVRVVICDGLSGKDVGAISFESDASSKASDGGSIPPKIRVDYVGKNDGTVLEFSGYATHPVSVTLRSPGYMDTHITLDRDSGDEVRVAMFPRDAPNPEQKGKAGQTDHPDSK